MATVAVEESNADYEGWRVALASSIGVFFGFASVLVYTFGIFLKPISTSSAASGRPFPRIRNCSDHGGDLLAAAWPPVGQVRAETHHRSLYRRVRVCLCIVIAAHAEYLAPVRRVRCARHGGQRNCSNGVCAGRVHVVCRPPRTRARRHDGRRSIRRGPGLSPADAIADRSLRLASSGCAPRRACHSHRPSGCVTVH